MRRMARPPALLGPSPPPPYLPMAMVLASAQVTSLIHHERIRTTVSKAKELRRLADRVVTLAKRGTPEARQKAGSIVRTEWDLAKLLTSARAAHATSRRLANRPAPPPSPEPRIHHPVLALFARSLGTPLQGQAGRLQPSAAHLPTRRRLSPDGLCRVPGPTRRRDADAVATAGERGVACERACAHRPLPVAGPRAPVGYTR